MEPSYKTHHRFKSNKNGEFVIELNSLKELMRERIVKEIRRLDEKKMKEAQMLRKKIDSIFDLFFSRIFK